MASAAAAAAAAAAGVLPLSLNRKQMEAMGLKTGPGRADVVASQRVATAAAQDEVTRLGFYSGWYDVRAALKEFRGDSFLLVADLDGHFGEAWYVALSDEAQAAALAAIAAARGAPVSNALVDAASAGPPAGGAEDDGGDATAGVAGDGAAPESEALVLLFDDSPAARVVDAPVACGAYRSDTADATAREVAALHAVPTRAPLAVRVVRVRGGSRGPAPCASFVDAALVAGWSSHPRDATLAAAYSTLLPTRDAGVQMGVPAPLVRVHAATQTAWRPKLSTATQVDGVAEMQARAAAALAAAAALSPPASVLAALEAAADGSCDADALRAAVKAAAAAAAAADAGSTSLVALPVALAAAAGARAGVGGGDHIGCGGRDRFQLPAATTTNPHRRFPQHHGDRGEGGAAVGGSSVFAGGGVDATVLRAFLQRVAPGVRDALQQNQLLDVTLGGLGALTGVAPADSGALRREADAGNGADDGESGGGAGDDAPAALGGLLVAAAGGVPVGIAGTGVREERTLADLELSAGKTVGAVEWHPRAPAVPWLAVAVHAPPTASGAAAAPTPAPPPAGGGDSHHPPHVVLLFTLAEFAVQVVLEAPAPVRALAWCPWAGALLLAAGLESGQVVVFDLSSHAAVAAAAAPRQQRQRAAAGAPVVVAVAAAAGATAAGAAVDDAAADDGSSPPGATPIRGAADGAAAAHLPWAAAPRLRPAHTSAPEASHAARVLALRWLPPSHQLSHHRHTFPAAERGGSGSSSSQVLSVGADGMVALWDTTHRQEAAPGQRRRQRAAAAAAAAASSGGAGGGSVASGAGGYSAGASGGGGGGGHDAGTSSELLLHSTLIPGAAAAGVLAPALDTIWAPLYRLATQLPPLTCCVMPWGGAAATSAIMGAPASAAAAVGQQLLPTDPLLVGTQDGRVVAVNWAPAGAGTHTSSWAMAAAAQPLSQPPAAGAGGKLQVAPTAVAAVAAGDASEVSLWTSPQHPGGGPVRSLATSPTFPDVTLSVCDYCFALWRRGCPGPLFLSPQPPAGSGATFVSGAWSPTRAAVVLIARSDGTVDVWDLADSTSAPSLGVPLVSHGLTCMSFAAGWWSGGSGSAAAAAVASSESPAGAGKRGGGVGRGGPAASVLPSAGGVPAPSAAFPNSTSALATAAVATASGTGSPAPSRHWHHLLALGDTRGAAHVLELPAPLRCGPPGEAAAFGSFLAREAARPRWAFSHAQAVALRGGKALRDAAAAAVAGAGAEAEATRTDAELARSAAQRDKDPVAAAALDGAALASAKVADAKRARDSEARYQELLRETQLALQSAGAGASTCTC